MRWLIIIAFNLFLILAGSLGILSIFHKLYVYGPLTQKALSRLEGYNNNEYFKFLSNAGNLPNETSLPFYLDVTPDKSKIRIGCFGDSHTAGTEVKPKNSFPSLLQTILGDKYQVINFGKGGYNSNQIFEIADYFTKVYDLDFVIFGPRGFYVDRSMSFNTYWNTGNVPYSRFTLENDKLKRIQVPGNSTRERILNYYSLIPSRIQLVNDISTPPFLHFLSIYSQKHIKNFFFDYTKEKEKATLVQQKMMEQFLNKHKVKVIHYTDNTEDEKKFKNIHNENYSLHYVDFNISRFPYLAAVSHPSSLGHLVHSTNIINILKEEAMIDGLEIVNDSSNISRWQKEDDIDYKAKNISRKKFYLNVRLNDSDAGTLKPLTTETDLTGRLKRSDYSAVVQKDETVIGFYFKNNLRASSLFFKVKNFKFKNKDFNNDLHIETLHPQVFLIRLYKGEVDYIENNLKIYGGYPMQKENVELGGVTFFQRISSQIYEPQLPTFRFVIPEDFDLKLFFDNSSFPVKAKIYLSEY